MSRRRSKSVADRKSGPPPELRAAGAALLIVDRSGSVVSEAGWEELFGCPAPRALPQNGQDGDDAAVAAVAAAVDQARAKRGTVRSCVEVSLDRHRYYSISAGPLAAGARDGSTAVLAVEITEAFKAGPKEGEAIRQLGHDLRTPLTSMGGAVELLQMGRMGPLSAEQGKLLGMLQQGIDLMLSLIEEATAPYRAATRGGSSAPDQAALSGGGLGR